MKTITTRLRQYSTAGMALIILACISAFGVSQRLSPSLKNDLAAQFHFNRQELTDAGSGNYKSIRAVHPSLRRISGWISSVGSGIALADVDGDGLANDMCHVEPRTDSVIVSPVPGTGVRYGAFILDPDPAGYDAKTMAPMGCIGADVNEDGKLDLVVYYWGRPPIAFLRNGDAALTKTSFTPVNVADPKERWFSNAALYADVDGDGHGDLIVGNYFNDGAHILDSEGSGIEELHNTKSRASNGGFKHLLLWKSSAPNDVHFAEIPNAFGAASRGWSLAIGSADLDGDLLPELYFANDFGPDRLLYNRSTPGHPDFQIVEGRRGFFTPASCVIGKDSFKGMGVDFGDINGDGAMDIHVSNIADTFALQESHFLWLNTGNVEQLRQGIAPFEHASERRGLSRSGWGWDTRFGDFNNDGRLETIQATGFLKGKVNRWPELQALGTGNDQLMRDPANWPAFKAGDDVSGSDTLAFFTQTQSGVFANISEQLGFAQPMVSRGVATADVDGDGNLDFVVANQWEASFYYHNESPNPGSHLSLRLLLPTGGSSGLTITPGHAANAPGAAAVGAQATVHLPDGRIGVAQVDCSNGHSGKRSPELHFGLGRVSADTNLAVDLKWRDRHGIVHAETVQLKPGWHTISLGEKKNGGRS